MLSALRKMSESNSNEMYGEEVDVSGDMEMTSEENTHRRAIEQEKIVYRESFERLRVLKPEIEHIRKVSLSPPTPSSSVNSLSLSLSLSLCCLSLFRSWRKVVSHFKINSTLGTTLCMLVMARSSQHLLNRVDQAMLTAPVSLSVGTVQAPVQKMISSNAILLQKIMRREPPSAPAALLVLRALEEGAQLTAVESIVRPKKGTKS
jgi:hypothetical protein